MTPGIAPPMGLPGGGAAPPMPGVAPGGPLATLGGTPAVSPATPGAGGGQSFRDYVSGLNPGGYDKWAQNKSAKNIETEFQGWQKIKKQDADLAAAKNKFGGMM